MHSTVYGLRASIVLKMTSNIRALTACCKYACGTCLIYFRNCCITAVSKYGAVACLLGVWSDEYSHSRTLSPENGGRAYIVPRLSCADLCARSLCASAPSGVEISRILPTYPCELPVKLLGMVPKPSFVARSVRNTLGTAAMDIRTYAPLLLLCLEYRCLRCKGLVPL